MGGLQCGFQIRVPIPQCGDESEQIRTLRRTYGQFHLQSGPFEIEQAKDG